MKPIYTKKTETVFQRIFLFKSTNDFIKMQIESVFEDTGYILSTTTIVLPPDSVLLLIQNLTEISQVK